MFQIINKLRKPQMNVQLVSNGTKSKVRVVNATPDQVVIMLYSIVTNFAKQVGVDKRHLMNKLIEIDKNIDRRKKDEEKQARYGLKN